MYINNLGLKSGCQIWKTASCITGMKSNSVEIIGRGSMLPCVLKLTNGLLPARRQEKKILTSCIFHHIALNYILKKMKTESKLYPDNSGFTDLAGFQASSLQEPASPSWNLWVLQSPFVDQDFPERQMPWGRDVPTAPLSFLNLILTL